MVRRLTKSAWLIAAAGFVLSLDGCGTGLLGDDDVQGDTCSVGTEPPYQPSALPTKTASDRVRTYLLRGLVNTYSLGLDRLAIKMSGLDLTAIIVEWPKWEEAAAQIADTYAGWPAGTEITLVGHSFGADDAVRLARYLNDRNIPVELLFLLDASGPLPLPPNVTRCIHFFIPSIVGDLLPDIFAGNPVVAEDGNARTQIMNIPFTPDNMGDGVGCANHFSIDVNTLAHNLVIEEVLRLVDPNSYTDPLTNAAGTKTARPQGTPSP